MKPTLPGLVAMVLLCPLGAQEGATKPVDASKRLEQLQTEQQELYNAWLEERRAVAKMPKDKQPKAIRMRPDYGPMRVKYLAAADQYPGDAVSFLMPALNVSSSADQYREVIDRLVGDHLDSPAIGDFGGYLRSLERMVDADYGREVIGKIEAHGKNLPLLGWVAFNKHEKTFRENSPSSPLFREMKKKVGAAVKAAGHERLQGMFDQLMTETEKFGMGMVAPDIAGIDLDGVEFKLSDYKGKVVFLDFWGDW